LFADHGGFMERLLTISLDDVDVAALVELAAERLTAKQKLILLHLAEEEDISNVTNLVQTLCTKLECAPSTVWSNMKALRHCRLLVAGDHQHKGVIVKLTAAGRLVSEKLKEEVLC
jgi:DNA-binding MarR family transcriptional regulator